MFIWTLHFRERENKQITAKWTEATSQLKLTCENIKNNYDVST